MHFEFVENNNFEWYCRRKYIPNYSTCCKRTFKMTMLITINGGKPFQLAYSDDIYIYVYIYVMWCICYQPQYSKRTNTSKTIPQIRWTTPYHIIIVIIIDREREREWEMFIYINGKRISPKNYSFYLKNEMIHENMLREREKHRIIETEEREQTIANSPTNNLNRQLIA